MFAKSLELLQNTLMCVVFFNYTVCHQAHKIFVSDLVNNSTNIFSLEEQDLKKIDVPIVQES